MKKVQKQMKKTLPKFSKILYTKIKNSAVEMNRGDF